MTQIIIGLILFMMILATVIIFILKSNDDMKKINIRISEMNDEFINILNNLRGQSQLNLSFEQCNTIIDNIIDDIWTNKYYYIYRLKDVRVISKMSDEINMCVNDVLSAISDDVKLEICKYYTYEYLIKKITRQVKNLFIDYTYKFKPSTK